MKTQYTLNQLCDSIVETRAVVGAFYLSERIHGSGAVFLSPLKSQIELSGILATPLWQVLAYENTIPLGKHPINIQIDFKDGRIVEMSPNPMFDITGDLKHDINAYISTLTTSLNDIDLSEKVADK